MKDPSAFIEGTYERLKGCFTEEYFIRGLSLKRIGMELGLPSSRLRKGAWICWAEQLPAIHEFYLGGWTKFPTHNFVRYNRHGKMKWYEDKYEETYAMIRTPITIEQAKQGWLAGMRHEKLVKVVPILGHDDNNPPPPGGRASQIIVVQLIRCKVVKFLKNDDDVFRGVWG